MKKIILVAALLLVGIASASADNRNERPVTVDQLPKVSQEFLAAHFKNLTVAYAVEEKEGITEETVSTVFQKGYKLNGKVIRSAKVMVAKPKA